MAQRLELLGYHEDGRVLFRDGGCLHVMRRPYGAIFTESLGADSGEGAQAVLTRETGWHEHGRSFLSTWYMAAYCCERLRSKGVDVYAMGPTAGQRVRRVVTFTLGSFAVSLAGLWLLPFAWRILMYCPVEVRLLASLGFGWFGLVALRLGEEEPGLRERDWELDNSELEWSPGLVASVLVLASCSLWAVLVGLFRWVTPGVVHDLCLWFDGKWLFYVPPVVATVLGYVQYAQYIHLAAQRGDASLPSSGQMKLHGCVGGLLGFLGFLLLLSILPGVESLLADSLALIVFAATMVVGLVIKIRQIPARRR